MANIAYAFTATVFLIAYSFLAATFGGRVTVALVAAALILTATSQYLAQSDERFPLQLATVITYVAGLMYILSLVALVIEI